MCAEILHFPIKRQTILFLNYIDWPESTMGLPSSPVVATEPEAYDTTQSFEHDNLRLRTFINWVRFLERVLYGYFYAPAKKYWAALGRGLSRAKHTRYQCDFDGRHIADFAGV